MSIIFYLVSAAMFVVCLIYANNMSKRTCVKMRTALWVLMVGDVMQVLAALYGSMTNYESFSAAVISAAMTMWLVNDRGFNFRNHR